MQTFTVCRRCRHGHALGQDPRDALRASDRGLLRASAAGTNRLDRTGSGGIRAIAGVDSRMAATAALVSAAVSGRAVAGNDTRY
jgi:hypothetical protein